MRHNPPKQRYKVSVHSYRTAFRGKRRYLAVISGYGVGLYQSAPRFKGKTAQEAIDKAKKWCNDRHEWPALSDPEMTTSKLHYTRVTEFEYDPEEEL